MKGLITLCTIVLMGVSYQGNAHTSFIEKEGAVTIQVEEENGLLRCKAVGKTPDGTKYKVVADTCEEARESLNWLITNHPQR